MAEQVAFDIAKGLVSQLSSPFLEQLDLWWNFKDDLEELKSTVSAIKAVLLDAEERSVTSNHVKDWLEKVKDALYDAEDLLDDIRTEGLRRDVMSGNKLRKEVRVFFSSSNQFAYGLKMGGEIKAIMARFSSIQSKMNGLNLEKRDNPVETERRPQTHSFVRKDEIIGREDDKAALLELLLDTEFQSEENVIILPIVGIPGLGKTALAQFVSNHERVKYHFDLMMWVCISDVFDLKIIVANIIKSATEKSPEQNLEMDQLQKQLRDKIDGKKYLLVLDDVWEEKREQWFSLKKLLMGGARGSRIIVTTRSHKVAKITSRCEPYVLKDLSDDDARSLFKQIAFEQRFADSTNPAFLEIGKQILERCCGVPLVIRTIASTLSSKKTENEWRSFKDNVLAAKISQKDGEIIPILRLSYDHLQPYLKRCFAYCRLYPKDHKINVQTLVQLWIAQDFVEKSNSSLSREEIGLEYFTDLVGKNFFQEVEEDEYEGMTCKMHDLMHDLAKAVAGRESGILDSNSNANEVDGNCRHISTKLPLFPLFKGKKLRSLLRFPNQEDRNMSEETWDLIISNCRTLRVLELNDLILDVVPSSIHKLKHLRYLDLSHNYDLKILPKSICKILNLQVLKLEGCMNLEELPKKIENLVNLTHLPFGGCLSLTHMPRGIGKLTSLESLGLFVVDKRGSHGAAAADLSELSGLNNLRGGLTITNLGFVKNAKEEFRAANLKEKQHLQLLALQWSGVPFLDDEDDEDDEEKSLEDLQPHPNLKELEVKGWRGDAKFPSWISLLTDLTAIEIWDSSKLKYLPSFSLLPHLQKLFIVELTELEYMEDSEASGGLGESETFFPSLTSLTLRQCPNLKGWWRKQLVDDHSNNDDNGRTVMGTSTMAFPCLSSLEIVDCPLTSMPLYPSLDDELTLINTSSRPLKQTMQMNIAQSISSLPLSKLKSFGVENIEELDPDILDECTQSQKKSLSGCLQQLTSLKSLIIIDWKELDLKGMQWETLKNLSHLEISNIPGLEYMDDSDPGGGQRVSKSFFPSLTYLRLTDCPNMKSWWRKRPIDDQNSNDNGTEVRASTIAFPCLSNLCIEDCPLTSMPLYPSLEDELTLIKTSSRPLEQTMQMNIAASTSSLPLSKLKCFHVENIEEQYPGIVDECTQNKSSSGWLQQLSSLERLTIRDCKELDLEDKQWEPLKNLSHLEINNIPQLVSLSLGLQHLTNLKYLYLKTLPNLTSLPEELRCLTNLEYLHIDEIPKLEERCRKGIGADWHKIAHIPNIEVNGTLVQDLQ